MIVQNRKQLNQPCETVSLIEGELIAQKLFQALENEPGIGLAANQIGIQKRVCVISAAGQRFALINPRIVKLSDPIVFGKEGCLSFPDEYLETLRYNYAEIQADNFSEVQKYSGILAVCCFHEIDHLFGVTMHDRKLNQIGPNSSCPCRSGRKFKHCCRPLVRRPQAI